MREKDEGQAASTALDARLAARLRLEELYAEYVACLDENRLEEWPEFFVEECTYGVWPRENWDAGLPIPLFLCTNRRQLRDRVIAHREANIFPVHWNRHLISSLRVGAAADGALSVSANYAIVQTRQEGESFLYQVGRSYDCIVEIDGRLRFKERKVVYDTHRVATLFVTPV